MTSFQSRKYFQENTEYVQFDTNVNGIEIYYHPEQLRVHVFKGRKKKPESLLFPTIESMILRIDSEIDRYYKKHIEKQKRKDREKISTDEMKMGF